jgi:TRAP-type transport system small permease protein
VGRHVEASLVADVAPRLARSCTGSPGVISTGLFGYLAMLMWNYGDQLARQNAHSLFGGIPHAPFAYYIAVLCLISRRHRHRHRHRRAARHPPARPDETER